jgi:hypothetical protein
MTHREKYFFIVSHNKGGKYIFQSKVSIALHSIVLIVC